MGDVLDFREKWNLRTFLGERNGDVIGICKDDVLVNILGKRVGG